MKSGKLPHYKIGNSTRLLQEDLDATQKVEKKSAPQQNQDESCLMCGHSELIEGHLQSTGKVYFKPLLSRFWSFKESMVPTTVRMCSACGYCHTFADTDHWKKLKP